MGWALLIPILVMTIPVAAIVMNGLQKIQRLRVEEARARAETMDAGGSSRIDALETEVAQLQQDLGEVHERLDFAERVLVQNRERQRLPEAGDSSSENATRD